MSQIARRDALRAVKLADGTYLIRSGCCAPARCAPAANQRCCRSVRCECDWPDTAGWAEPGTTIPTVRRSPAARSVVLPLICLASTVTVGLLLWFIVVNLAAVLVALAAGGLVVAIVTWIRGRSRPGGGYTVNNYYR